MLAVAWGDQAIELLLAREAARERTWTPDAEAAPHPRRTPEPRQAPERIGPIAVEGAAGASTGSWRCWLSGRLDNASELERELGAPANAEHALLLARAFAAHGERACEQLRGTFVAIAFEREREIAFVIRDQLGGRPLVLAQMRGGALLAEHERAIVELLPQAVTPDRLALAQWIDLGTIPAQRTLFSDISRIGPGHRARLSCQGMRVERYWRPTWTGVAPGSATEQAERLRECAFDAVARCIGDNDGIGLRLSGGLDSACVAAALAARGAADGAIALSGVFASHPEIDERPLIEATAAHTGLSSELIEFDESASILAPALAHIERWLLPPATPNLHVWRPLVERARQLGVEVMLDGEGGDQMFGFCSALIVDMLAHGRLLAAWRLTGRIPGLGGDARLRRRALRFYGVSPLIPDALKRWRQTHAASGTSGARSLLMPADAQALSELALEREAPPPGPRWWQALGERLTVGGEPLDVSAQLQRDAIDERIERRHPFLFDLELMHCVLSIPPSAQFDPTRDRPLLRDGLTGHIPESVRTRHAKSYFTDLLRDGLGAEERELTAPLSQRGAPVRDIVDGQALDSLLASPPESRTIGEVRRIWRVGLADAWMRTVPFRALRSSEARL